MDSLKEKDDPASNPSKRPHTEVDKELMRQMIAGQASLDSKVVRRIPEPEEENTDDPEEKTSATASFCAAVVSGVLLLCEPPEQAVVSAIAAASVSETARFLFFILCSSLFYGSRCPNFRFRCFNFTILSLKCQLYLCILFSFVVSALFSFVLFA